MRTHVATFLALLSILALTAARDQIDNRWDRFAGDWHVTPGAAAIVDQAIDKATASMSLFTRRVARGRLQKTNAAPARVRLHRQGADFVIQFDDRPPLRLPIAGTPIQDGERTIRVELDSTHDSSSPVLRQLGETQEGKRENVYRLGKDPNAMTMEVTVTSARLPSPVHYTLGMTR
jgi:hypothetical protein